MEREPEDSGVHEGARHRQQRSVASVLQRARAKAGGEAREGGDWLGRSAGTRSSEGYCDSVLAGIGFAGESGAARLPRDSIERLLPGSRLERGAALCGGPDERRCREADAGAGTAGSWRRVVYVAEYVDAENVDSRIWPRNAA